MPQIHVQMYQTQCRNANPINAANAKVTRTNANVTSARETDSMDHVANAHATKANVPHANANATNANAHKHCKCKWACKETCHKRKCQSHNCKCTCNKCKGKAMHATAHETTANAHVPNVDDISLQHRACFQAWGICLGMRLGMHERKYLGMSGLAALMISSICW